MSLIQIIINSLIRASVLCTLSIGLTLVYDILKFANFVHVELAVAAAYMTMWSSDAIPETEFIPGPESGTMLMFVAGLYRIAGVGRRKLIQILF